MRNLGKVMRSSSPVQREWESNLIEFLRNYRATPHSSTGVAPYQLMFQSNARTKKLPSSGVNLSESKAQLH